MLINIEHIYIYVFVYIQNYDNIAMSCTTYFHYMYPDMYVT